MKIDEYIAHLVKLRQSHGPDLMVMAKAGQGATTKKAQLPRMAHLRKDQPRTLFAVNDLDKNRGEKVVLL